MRHSQLMICSMSGLRGGVCLVLLLWPALAGEARAQSLDATVTINMADTMAAMPSEGLGVCTAVYDNDLVGPTQIAPLLKAAGITAVRYPGGSYGDIYNWQNSTCNDGGYVASGVTFSAFMAAVVTPASAQAVITVNYGSNPQNTGGGSPSYAASWVANANVTNHYGIKYWEIGNEIYGNGYFPGQDWEYDLHYTNLTASNRVGQAALSPGAYGSNSLQFINDMKAEDSTIQCGVFVNASESNTWNTPLLRAVGTNADFVILHWYPGTNVASTLAASTTIVPTIQDTLSQLTNILGAATASRMKIAITETGAGTATGAPVSLFAADNYLTWLENGIVNVDYQILHTDILENNETPGHAYYGTLLCHLLASIGDTFLEATSSQADLRVHATKRQDGKVGVMLVNLSPSDSMSAAVTISGPAISGTGTLYQFGLTNFTSTNDYPSYPASTNTVSGLGNSFTISVPAYTIMNLLIPTNTPPVLAAIANQSVNSGHTLSLNATATDTNLPTPILTFSLLSGPSGATLTRNSNTNATFNWEPLYSQANSTNSISIKAIDNSSPPLSATDTFSVIVHPNTAPVLAAIGNQQVNVGQTVSLTAAATDSNLPTPTLTFSLLSAPANASLVQANNTNAAFSLRPSVAQASSTIPVSLFVTDGGNPPLSATDTFSVAVNPITLPTLSGSAANLATGQFGLTVSGMAGPDYAVLYSTNLLTWSTIFETNSPPMPFTWVDTHASLTNPSSYYQVLLGSPLQ
ncbi:MAG: hypothetical protein ABSA83_03195 [Verrucomicrobiota bacterium]|jgi:hypothetical protein